MIRSRLLATLALIALATLPASVQADLIASLENVTGPTAGVGTFEVLLSNTAAPGGPSFDVASFSFALMISPGSGVQFTDASTSTTSAQYIFAGTGGASVDPGFTLSLDVFPNTSFTGSDSEFTFPSIAVNPGDVFGLGLISYSVGPDASGGDVQVSFIPDGTSLSDASGSGIVFSSDDRGGVIRVRAVPEPGSLVLAMGGFGIAILSRGYRRT
jgi:hypothetical protein